jgi:hypothetical protein
MIISPILMFEKGGFSFKFHARFPDTYTQIGWSDHSYPIHEQD